uniref:Uncharacterized protein n=1 Tax=Arundo donax TaxID=35708 RepID=A0A0A9DRL4_ARUDO
MRPPGYLSGASRCRSSHRPNVVVENFNPIAVRIFDECDAFD